MTIIQANYIVTCDEDSTIINDSAIVFDTKIIDIDTIANIKQKYPNTSIKNLGLNSVILPGLINSHTHLEFSANQTTLRYGNFISWLYSVIANREELIEKATTSLIEQKLTNMLQSGTTTIGAISSYGFDLEALKNAKQNIVYFSEIIGSNPAMIDTLFDDFKAKLKNAKEFKSDRFIPAIAIHSPYSVHPFLIRETLKLAKDGSLPITAHFLESSEEYEWLESSSGKMSEFFKEFLNQTQSLTTKEDFLNQFKSYEKLSFTHCSYAKDDDLKLIKSLDATIIHSPVSNRFLTNNTIDFTNLLDENFAIGTDGLSSNYSLSLWDEMRNALFIHKNIDIHLLAQKLILATTKGGAKALGFSDKGSLKKGFNADIISVTLPDSCQKEDILLQLILHTKKVDTLYIKGERLV
ncbi:MAG: metal-dependent hydrolase [Arcobacter butzleri]|nr:metal-dependent hydrolase [Aliarcobacter butzleri]